MKACHFCAEQIQDAATVCRFCNRELTAKAKSQPAPPKTASKVLRYIATVIGALFVIGLIGQWLGLDTSQDRSPVTQTQSTTPTTNSVLELSAKTLFATYEANEVYADQQYKGQRLVVNGTIDRIGKDIIGAPFLTLDRDEDSFSSVQAMFPRSSERILAELTQGRYVRASCLVDGKLGNVILRDCRLIAVP